ncbi:uncharacterized protein LOC144112457 isoform X1 [Amblyomma americanum]
MAPLPPFSEKASSAGFGCRSLRRRLCFRIMHGSTKCDLCLRRGAVCRFVLRVCVCCASGVSTIPVALVPLDGGAIRLNNPDAVQSALQAISPLVLKICDARQYGRGGVLCRSADQAFIMDLLKCTSFGSQSLWDRVHMRSETGCGGGLGRWAISS